MKRLFERVAIVGVGLIGGSLGLAIRGRGLAGMVVGVGRRRSSLEEALEKGAVDEITLDLETGVRSADLVVLAVPVGRMISVARRVAPGLRVGSVLIDVGSTKEGIVSELEPLARSRGSEFLGCHPLTGSERRSVRAAREDLFEGAVAVITPTGRTPADVEARVRGLWEGVGSRVVRMGAADHDRLLARTSHLPHLAAAALVLAALEGDGVDRRLLTDLVAGGFRDTTRVASSDPSLWRDILIENRRWVLAALDGLMGVLEEFRRALEWVGDRGSTELASLLRRAKERRNDLLCGR